MGAEYILGSQGERSLLMFFPCQETSGTDMTDNVRGVVITPSNTPDRAWEPTSSQFIQNGGLNVTDHMLANIIVSQFGSSVFGLADIPQHCVISGSPLNSNGGAPQLAWAHGDPGDAGFAADKLDFESVTTETTATAVFTRNHNERLKFDSNNTVRPAHALTNSPVTGATFPIHSCNKSFVLLSVFDSVGTTVEYADTTPAVTEGEYVRRDQIRWPMGAISTGSDAGMAISYGTFPHAVIRDSAGNTFTWSPLGNGADSIDYLFEADGTTPKTGLVTALIYNATAGTVRFTLHDNTFTALIDETVNVVDHMQTGTDIDRTATFGGGSNTRMTGASNYGIQLSVFDSLPAVDAQLQLAQTNWIAGTRTPVF